MKSGILKQLFIEHTVTKIQIEPYIPQTSVPLTVVGVTFDKRTRRVMFLDATKSPAPRTNRIQTIRTYLLDFKDTHTLYVYNKDVQDVYALSNDYEFNAVDGVLTLKLQKRG